MNPIERQLFILRYWIAFLRAKILMLEAFPPDGLTVRAYMWLPGDDA